MKKYIYYLLILIPVLGLSIANNVFAAATFTHHWQLNGNTTDIIGTANMTDHGSPTYTSPFLPWGQAYNGTASAYSTITGLVADVNGSFSTSIWFKYNGTDGVKGGWYFDGASAPNSATIYYGGVPGVDICFNGSCHVFGQGSSDCSNINDGNPHMVSYGYDGVAHSIEVWCDDVSLGSYSVSLNINSDARGGVNVEDNNSNSAQTLFQDEWYGTGVINQTQVDSLWTYIPPGPPSANLVGNLAAPSNGSIIPDFSNWVVDLSAPTGSTIYAQVSYQRGNQWTLVNRIYSDNLSVNIGNQTSTRITIPKQNPLLQLTGLDAQNTQWIAELYISTSTRFPGASSSESIFTITPFATSTPTGSSTVLMGPYVWNGVQTQPSWEPQNLASSTIFLNTQCQQPTGITDIGGGISYAFCTVVNQLFVPGPVGIGLAQGAVTDLEGVPPYSWFFQVNNAIVGAQSQTTSTGLSFNDIPAGFGTTTTITILSADPTTDPNITRITKYSPHSLLELVWNSILVGVIALLIYSIYKLVL